MRMSWRCVSLAITPLQALICSMQNPYQRPMLPYPRCHWKLIPTPSRSPPSPDGVEDKDRKPEHLRCRLTRLGDILLDKRDETLCTSMIFVMTSRRCDDAAVLVDLLRRHSIMQRMGRWHVVFKNVGALTRMMTPQ